MPQAFSKIWIMIIVVFFTAGGVLAWQYFGIEKEKTTNPEEYFISLKAFYFEVFGVKNLLHCQEVKVKKYG